MCALAVGASSTEERSTTLHATFLCCLLTCFGQESDIGLKMFSVIAALTGKYMVGQFDSSFSLGTLVDSMDFISVFAQARLNVEGRMLTR